MSEPKLEPTQDLKPVLTLNEFETITQIMPFGSGSLACLTSTSRILIPGPEFGKWFELPVPPFSSTEH